MKKLNFKSIMSKICLLFAVCLLVSFNPVKAEAATVTGQDIVNEAKRHLGVPYQWGGNGPSTFDCSGLTKYVYGQFGITLPRVAEDQASSGTAVSRENLQPGDLVFWGSPAYHVGIYIGNNQYIHAPQDNEVVKISTLSTYTSARRILKTTGWVNSNGWYYYINGVKQTGWVQVDAVWYYLDSTGLMKANEWIQSPDTGKWYYVGSNGAMLKNQWIQSTKNLKWYYVGSDGAMYANQWVQSPDTGYWYYLDSDGIMLANTSMLINGKTYYFDSIGKCTNP